MNPAEQKSHKTVTDNLRADLKQLSEDYDALFERVGKLDEHVADNWADNDVSHKGLREDVAYTQRCITNLQVNLDAEVIERYETFHAFVKRGFWSRVNWLLTGR
jgi:predicted  nucleic acid-binding Zn-ribbon protein